MAGIEKEKQAKLAFLGTVERKDGTVVARVAEVEALARQNISVESLRSAGMTGQFNAMRVNGGIHIYTADQIDSRMESLKGKPGLELTLAELAKARDAVAAKTAPAKPAPRPAAAV